MVRRVSMLLVYDGIVGIRDKINIHCSEIACYSLCSKWSVCECVVIYLINERESRLLCTFAIRVYYVWIIESYLSEVKKSNQSLNNPPSKYGSFYYTKLLSYILVFLLIYYSSEFSSGVLNIYTICICPFLHYSCTWKMVNINRSKKQKLWFY